MRKYYFKILRVFSFMINRYYKNRLRVLAYHNIKNKELFGLHIKFLKKKYNIISVEDVWDHIISQKALPPYSLVITFDDGDISVLEKGLPIIKEYNIKCCLFIITSLINTQEDFWFKAVRKEERLMGKSQKEIESRMNYLKGLSNSNRIQEVLKYNIPVYPQLASDDLLHLRKNNVFIGNHSHTHPMFDKCTETELEEELQMTIKYFEKFGLEEGCQYFAYPNGNWDIISEKILNKMGIKMAFLFDHLINKKELNPFRISRIRTNSDMDIDELRVKVSGLHSLLQRIKN